MMTRKEQLQHMEEKFQGDFWAAVEFLITEEAWGMSEFEEADIVDIFNESFDNPVEENMGYLRNLVTGEEDEQVEAQDAGATWMETVLTECENPEEWLGLNYQEFLQAAANATRPAFPAFETTSETDAAYQGAWGQLESSKRLHAEDKVYQEDLEKRKMEGWKKYDGK